MQPGWKARLKVRLVDLGRWVLPTLLVLAAIAVSIGGYFLSQLFK